MKTMQSVVLILTVALMNGSVQASEAGPSELIWFTDQAEFEAFMQGQGKVLEGIEDFEESILNPDSVFVFNDPLESGVPNLPGGFPFPDGMTGLPNLTVQSNVGGGDPSDEIPRGVTGLLAVSAGSSGAVSDVVLPTVTGDSLDLIFTDEKSGVGFNTLAIVRGDSVEVRVYSSTNEFLGMMTTPADPTGANFIGVWSPDPIARINVFNPGVGETFEGADNIQAWDNVINVPRDFPTIQGAIDAATDGNEIIVSQGLYFENINFNGKAVTLHSIDPTDPAVVAATIISGGEVDTVVTCDSGEGSDTVLSGFTITGGVSGASGEGGGMHNDGSSPTVTYCTFAGNTANFGAGMGNESNSSPTVSNCTFSQNTTGGAGGGMDNFTGSSPTVTNCQFMSNAAQGGGGGMNNESESNPTVSNCTFSGNTADAGGGGMTNIDDSSPTVTNCTFNGNLIGGGMFNDNGSNPTVTNCIFWGNSDEFTGAGAPLVTFCDVQGGFDGEGNIEADPMFAGAPGGDVHINSGSPCIDAADNTAPGLIGITEDLDGNPRFIDDPDTRDTGIGDPPVVDMGAYEFQPVACLADLTGDAIVGPADLAIILGNWGPVPPGDPIADLNNDGVVGPADLAIILGNWGPCP